jgi:hypothetical protein
LIRICLVRTTLKEELHRLWVAKAAVVLMPNTYQTLPNQGVVLMGSRFPNICLIFRITLIMRITVNLGSRIVGGTKGVPLSRRRSGREKPAKKRDRERQARARLHVIEHYEQVSRNVCQTCRFFGISRSQVTQARLRAWEHEYNYLWPAPGAQGQHPDGAAL